jgi:hypothetical protein
MERVSREAVTFDRTFFVEGLDRELPAGTYNVEIVEELIEGLSFLAYRVVSTSIRLPMPGGGAHSYQLARINSALVRGALNRSSAEIHTSTSLDETAVVAGGEKETRDE